MKIESGFYKKSLAERQNIIAEMYDFDIKDITTSHVALADQMIENCIGSQTIPLGLGLNFSIDGKEVVVPMAIEEPSVIAAASGAAKTIKANGGFWTTNDKNLVCSQICIRSYRLHEDYTTIMSNKVDIIYRANELCRNMVNRGGGVEDLILRIVPRTKSKSVAIDSLNDTIADGWCIIHILINVCDSMGANISATIAEGLTPHLQELLPLSKVSVRIVSNLNTYRTTKAKFEIPIEQLAFKEFNGITVAKGILEVYSLGLDDPYRTCTHNKGVMNGVIAVALATGQDTRAIEANVHGYAHMNDYSPLTTYSIQNNKFIGQIELPLPIGTVGGSIQTLPSSRSCLKILGHPNVDQLSRVFVFHIDNGMCRSSFQFCSFKSIIY